MHCVVVAGFSLGCMQPPVLHAELPPAVTFADFGTQAIAALRQDLWDAGRWHSCDGGCRTANKDWGDDSLTYVLYLRWLATHDAALVPMFAALTGTAESYDPCHGPLCSEWSDIPEWDAVADLRAYEVTGDFRARNLAERAYQRVAISDAYTRGACPTILYQQPFGGGGGLKTLETDSNAIKAAILLWQDTHKAFYLEHARRSYRAVRAQYLDPEWPLYTTYVIDTGRACTPIPRRFFASVNGNMIWNGIALAGATGELTYLTDAIATARAVDQRLSDARGVFTDPQAENDIVEPLVEAFYMLAREHDVDFARAWIVRNADAALVGTRTRDGLYGRMFDGPAPTAPATAWQTNGGLALAVAAAALDPTHVVRRGDDWTRATTVRREITTLPATIRFTGSAIALYGTLGERCCEAGYASVSLDGTALPNATGIWQNKSSSERSFDDVVLFAWRWPEPGDHELTLTAPAPNAKQGGPFIHLRYFQVIR